jgi:hypothetical protein
MKLMLLLNSNYGFFKISLKPKNKNMFSARNLLLMLNVILTTRVKTSTERLNILFFEFVIISLRIRMNYIHLRKLYVKF